MSKKFYTHSTQKQILDKDTGELVRVEDTKTFVTKVDKDKFFMTFIDYISPLFNLKSDTAKNVLNLFCMMSEYNTGKVTLSTARRNEIVEELGISQNTLTNCIKSLKDNNIIQGDKGDFFINPLIHWKGDAKTRSELLNSDELKVTFSFESKED